MSRRRAGRSTIDEVLAQGEEAPIEAPVEVPSASRARRRQVNFDAEESEAGVSTGVAGAAVQGAPEGGAAVRRSRFQPSAEKESDGSEDVVKDEQSDINPQALAQVLRSKSDADRSLTQIIELCIPAARVNNTEDPPLQLLHIKQNDFAAQVSLLCSVTMLMFNGILF
jgi:hypothetical protein